MTNPKIAAVSAALGLVASGCMFTEQNLATRYAAEFACPHPEVSYGPGRAYRVEGCDKVAFYFCDGQMQCRLEHSRELTAQERLDVARRHAKPPASAEEVAAKQAQAATDAQLASARSWLEANPDKVQSLGQVDSDDWHMQLASMPDNDAYLVLHFSTQRALTSGTCRPTISLDNHVLTTSVVDAHPAHEVKFLLAAAPLRNMRAEQPVRGVICGANFSMDDAARKHLANIVRKQQADVQVSQTAAPAAP